VAKEHKKEGMSKNNYSSPRTPCHAHQSIKQTNNSIVPRVTFQMTRWAPVLAMHQYFNDFACLLDIKYECTLAIVERDASYGALICKAWGEADYF